MLALSHRIVDDSEFIEDFFYSGQWERSYSEPYAYRGTLLRWLPVPDSTIPQYLTFAFTGEEIRVVGRPTQDLRLNYTVTSGSVNASMPLPRNKVDPPGMIDAGVVFSGSNSAGKV